MRRFLTGYRQYLLSLVASLAALASVQAARHKIEWSDPWTWITIAPPILVFFCKRVSLLRRTRRERNQVRRGNDSEPLGGYFVIGPYPEERYSNFRRADNKHEIVFRWLCRTNEHILVLSGLSGTGKSSLLQAYIIPKLREADPLWQVVLVRSFDDPLAALRRQLTVPGCIWTNPRAELNSLPWDQILSRAVAQLRINSARARLLLIFDQFEELLILPEPSEQDLRVEAMHSFLQFVSSSAPEGVTVLLSLRSEYRTLLETMGVPPLRQDANWQEVPAFSQSDAFAFLTAAESGVQIAEQRLQRVLREAAAHDGTRGLIRPIILNMLGVVLRRIADSPEADRATKSLLEDDLRRFVNAFEIRDVARPVLRSMLTEADTRRPRTVGDIAQETRINVHRIQNCLHDLALAGYVRQVICPSEVSGRVWEISHDFVARLLGPILKTPMPSRMDVQIAKHPKVVRYAFFAFLVGVVSVAYVFRAELVKAYKLTNSETKNEYSLGEFGLRVNNSDGCWVATADGYKALDLISAVPRLAKLPSIMEQGLRLELSKEAGLINLDALGHLKYLRALQVNYCGDLTNIAGVSTLTDLESLDLGSCKNITDIDAIHGLHNLRSLRLYNCDAVIDLDPIKGLTGLKSLDLGSMPSLTNTDVLRDLKDLESLDLSCCYHLTNTAAISELRKLKILNMYNCGDAPMPVVNNLKNLEYLDLSLKSGLKNVDMLDSLRALKSLKLKGCNYLVDVYGLRNLVRLRLLDISGCSSLIRIDAIGELENLQTLDLSNCTGLRDVNSLRKLTCLQSLDLSGCEGLTNVNGISELISLTTLSLRGCKVMENVDALMALTNLKELDLLLCPKLTAKTVTTLHANLPHTRILSYNTPNN